MGKITGKKRKLNYKPIIFVAAITLPVLVGVTILIWPKSPVELVFTRGPIYDAHLTSRGMVRIEWETNVPARGNVFYRFRDEARYEEIPTRLDTRGTVAIPADAGKTLEFYVKADADHRQGSIQSPIYRVHLLAATTSAPAAK